MFTIHWYSLPMFAAAITSAALAVASVALPHARTTTTKTFCMLNVGVAAWTAAYALEIELSPLADIALAPIGSGLWWLSLVKTFGLAATAVHWYLFAAAQSRHMKLVRGPSLWGTIVFFAYTVLVVPANPLHHLYVTASAAGRAIDGPLRTAYLLPSSLYGIAGTYLLLSSLWREPGPRSRKRAVIMALAICVPLVGGIASNIAQAVGAHFPFDPTPAFFGITTLVIAFDVFHAGLADIVPLSAAQAFQATSDVAIVCDSRLRVLTANAAAKRQFPAAATGVLLADALPDVAAHAATCLETDCDYLPFELTLGDDVYWGRIYPTRSRSGGALGCVVLLSDITELRYAQEQLTRAIGRHGGPDAADVAHKPR
ncbi:MAG: hypothetical protein FDZ70_01810 [Actinobacteria bacterium]|nr:MAG: hypothetical protein FDZ70_01810 [Actinomycetota bacterium]